MEQPEDSTGAINLFHRETLFSTYRPKSARVPFVFNSPHSGREYSEKFLAASKLAPKILRKSEDFLVDELFSTVPSLGAPLLTARFPRAWLDVNREPYELDPAMFNGPLPAFVNTRTARVTSGLGTIAKIVSEFDEIYHQKLDVDDAIARIETVYRPYHGALARLIAETIIQFGHAVLIDCHSMPSTTFPSNRATANTIRADFILGDRFGTSCSQMITHAAAEILREMGYHVAINKPYAGGFITEHYGRPENGIHALQLEINRALYMNEALLEKNHNFDELAKDLQQFVARLISLPDHGLQAEIPIAAE